MSGSERIHNLYDQMLNRDAEPKGLEFYLERMEQYRQKWHDDHARDETGATVFALSKIALAIFEGAQRNDLDTLNRKIRRLSAVLEAF